MKRKKAQIYKMKRKEYTETKEIEKNLKYFIFLFAVILFIHIYTIFSYSGVMGFHPQVHQLALCLVPASLLLLKILLPLQGPVYITLPP